ncbi:TRAP transporter substrate-binding protein DctP [Desulfobacter curvatus]|uniref:TRAP transporter substrate-binding protein DctP n=1 Tax=Desulfobacter curvatus TaxID=2290 RepID=UPI00037E8C0A|nr:TRAP transporter substrate-binding protein DctP [Desulfobacter curvatus]
MNRYVLIAITLIVFAWVACASAKTLPLMRISVENNDRHVQTQAVKRYADEIKKNLQGRINVQFFSNARLFRDRDIIQAMAQGRVEMGVPGTWHVSRFEPNVQIFLLPAFYGKPAEANYKAVDGEVGQTIADRLKNNLRLKVIGKWIDLGHAHLFGVDKKILRHENIAGLRVRVAGGEANKLRIEAMGGLPRIIPWPDLPEYLQQGRIDAVLTSYETVESARLWKIGIKYAFEDQEYFAQYIPLVRLSFWNKLSDDIQRILADTWEKYVDTARREAAESQHNAKNILVKNGVEVILPNPLKIEVWRQKMLTRQNEFVKILKIDPKLVSQIMKTFKYDAEFANVRD